MSSASFHSNERPGLVKLNTLVSQLQYNGCASTNGEYLDCVKTVYGEKKVREVCARYHLFRKGSETKPLKLADVKKLQQGLSDISGRDLDQFIKKLRRGDPLSTREKDVAQAFGQDAIDELKKHSTSSDLPVALFNSLIDAFKNPNQSYKSLQFQSDLSLAKVTGLPGKYIEHGWVSHTSGRSLEDEERLKLYEELGSLKAGEQARYCELLTKLLVKKHLYYEQEDPSKLKLGMLVPAPQGANGEKRFYRVSEILDSGWGKFAYRLLPATTEYGTDMPELLLYRSSSTLPTAADSFTSYLSDINPLPPGYLSRHRSKEKELHWLSSPSKTSGGVARPLVITGHSLGASNSQLALMNLSKSGKWVDRGISLELFDSPAIAASDAKEFADWHGNQTFIKPLTFQYYVSQGDPVPLVGSIRSSSYLGSGSNKATATVHKMHLTPGGLHKKEISGLGPHGRIYFRGTKGVDFIDYETTIERFDKEKKYLRLALNMVKTVGSILVFGTLGVFGGLKRFFIGRRHHDPVIVQLLKKIILKEKSKIEKAKEDPSIKQILEDVEMIEIELLKPALEDGNDLQGKISEGITRCTNLIKQLKSQTNESSTIIKINEIKKIKAHFKDLEKKLSEKEKINAAKKNLYVEQTLKAYPNFESHIEALISKHPDLKEDLLHMMFVLKSVMKISSEPLTVDDIERLSHLQAVVAPIDPELAALIASQVKALTQTLQNKKKLLEGLCIEIFQNNTPHSIETLSPEDKIKLFTQAEQIINNPFEVSINNISLLDRLLQENPSEAMKGFIAILKNELAENNVKKKSFWGRAPILERKAHELAINNKKKTHLIDCKREGLLKIALQAQKNSPALKEALIVGAGPAGLMHGIALALSGNPYKIIEMRSQSKKPRDNIIVLGKGDPKDIRILMFLGVIADLELKSKISIERFQDPTLEIRIADLEESLKGSLKTLGYGDPKIIYDRKITKIENSQGHAKVSFTNPKDLESGVEEISPSLIFVADGFSGTTREMLGISREVLAKTTQIVYSVFKKPSQPNSSLKTFKYKAQNNLRATSMSAKVFLNSVFNSKTLEESYGEISVGGPSALFRIPEEDYTGRAPREKEQEYINHARDKIKRIQGKIAKLEGGAGLTGEEIDLLQRLRDEEAKLTEEFQAYLKAQGEETHRVLDGLHSLFGKRHKMNPMQIQSSTVVDVIVSKAERSFCQVGATSVFIRGDASHSTDPYSGYGCKTSLEETLADQFSLANMTSNAMSDLELACQAFGHRYYQDSMINKGLISRSIYANQTELLRRYLDLGVKEGLITEEESHFLNFIVTKAEKLPHNSKIQISDEELGRAKHIQVKLIKALDHSLKERLIDVENFIGFENCPLKASEAKLLKSVILQIFDNPKKISSKEREKIKRILAKLANHGIKEGAIIALILENPRSSRL